MLQNLFIIQRATPDTFSDELLSRFECLLWKTCLRQMVIGVGPENATALMIPTDRLYAGEQAYRFCLEVICGLHSPLIGETEVLGQFRTFFKNVSFGRLSYGQMLHRSVQNWLSDAKMVREKYLIGIGSQSYGSVVRRALKGLKHVTLVGSGQFVDELLPWILKEKIQVQIVARNEMRLIELARAHGVQTCLLGDFVPEEKDGQALILAAPLSRGEFQDQFGSLSSHELVIDLRGDSDSDPLTVETRLTTLGDVFQEVRATESQLARKTSQAHRAISRLVGEKMRRVENRPFGWDDLCA